jgi:glycosyltransferase involved in cell wall biosynthesis
MKIDFKTVVIAEETGYGNASRELKSALRGQGIEICPGSSIMLNFCMPPDYIFRQTTIGYTPWESTEVPEGWVAGLKAVDDLWVTSEFVGDVFSLWRRGEIYELPHGIDKIWEPVEHHLGDGPFTFLHVGDPAVRKGGDFVLRAWLKAFANRKDVRLIYKCNKYPIARVKDRSGSIIASPGMFDNVKIIGKKLTREEMHSLYVEADCMVYPTRGEGFGLIPFEAIGSGLPTIIPKLGVASSFVESSSIQLENSKWVNSDYQKIHPGKWLDHDVDELIEAMEAMISDYEKYRIRAKQCADDLHLNFSWDEIGKRAAHRIKFVK